MNPCDQQDALRDDIAAAGGDHIGDDTVAGGKVMGDKHITIIQPALASALRQLHTSIDDTVGRAPAFRPTAT